MVPTAHPVRQMVRMAPLLQMEKIQTVRQSMAKMAKAKKTKTGLMGVALLMLPVELLVLRVLLGKWLALQVPLRPVRLLVGG
jgi:hypothetical protein